MRTRKSVSTQGEFIEHETFTPLVCSTTGGMGKECLMYHNRLARSWLPSRKGSSMPKLSHVSEPEPHSHSWDLGWFVLEALGQEECHVTLRMLILTSKLLKEPLNWTIDVFPYFKMADIRQWRIGNAIKFSSFFSDFLIKNAIDLENSFFL